MDITGDISYRRGPHHRPHCGQHRGPPSFNWRYCGPQGLASPNRPKFDMHCHSSYACMQRYLSFPFFWLLKTRKKASSRLSKEVQKAVSDHLFRRAQEEALSASFRVTREYERRIEGEKSYRKPEYRHKCLAEESVGPRSLAPIRGGSSQGEFTVLFATSSWQLWSPQSRMQIRLRSKCVPASDSAKETPPDWSHRLSCSSGRAAACRWSKSYILAVEHQILDYRWQKSYP